MSISWIDLLIVITLLTGVAIGYKRGFIRQVLSLTGWLIACIAAFFLYEQFAAVLLKLPWLDAVEASQAEAASPATAVLDGAKSYVSNAIAFVVLFVAFRLLLTAAGWLLHGIASMPVLRTVNRVGGAAVALAEAAVIVSMVLLLLQELPSPKAQSWVADSAIFAWLKANNPIMLDGLSVLWKNG